MERIAQQCLSSGNAAVLAAHRKQAALVFGYWATYYASAPELVTIAFARIIHAYPEARPFAISCLATDTLHLRSLTNTTDSALIEMLVAIWRLLRFSLKDFRHLLEARLLWPLLKHEHVAVRLLVANLLGLYLDMGDKLLSDTIDKIVATEASTIIVLEEGTSVDLRVFEVQEDIRIHNLRQTLVQAEQADHDPSTLPSNVVEIAGEYLPRVPHQSVAASQVVPTSVSTRNLSLLAKALRRSDFVLLQGLSGSGKTFLIEDLARSVGRDRDLVRIHLGDQTDAKLLLGTYITSATPGEFIWQSGVLANAVAQGKWILFEDIDKAPNDVLSILLPLLETRSIHIPSRGETIHAGPGLKVLATKATDGQAHWTPARLLGGRLWTPVVIEMAPNDELREVITAKYPLLRNMATTMMQTYEAVVELLAGKSGTTRVRRKGTSARPLGTLDLMKWCRRVQAVYMTNGIRSSDQTINQQVSDDIFSEAVDCFASSTSSTELKHLVVETIGRSLQVPPERVQFYLESHTPSFSDAATFLQVGRASLAKPNKVVKTRNRPFALTAHALRLLEQLIVAIRLKEPLLLVGETGTGKTTVIQQLATMMGHTLVAINMSQQTESGDLLGGFKPVDTRLIAIPLLEDFETLFSRTLSAHKNARFLAEIRKSFNKGQWSRLTALLTQSVKIARKSLTKSQNATDDVEQDLTSSRKKRKLDDDLFAAWDNFAANLDTFQAQHQRASKSFTFAFVEGALVKAVKRGDWVLLDEINLAATDTLESINGLLQEDGSILLSEKGDVQAIMPHPDFRIFSCMNPATDVGKRDLPAGIRSRFTELYIQSPDSSMPDLLAIIIKYIGGLCVEDSKACTDVAYLYTTTKQLASENKLVDGGNQCPHYSIRTLTRTLSYVLEISAIYGLRRSLYEGFCMSYLTLLNKESEAILKPIIEEYTILRVRNVKSSIAQIPRRPSDGEWVQFKHYWLPQGPLEPRDDPRYIMTPFVERNMLNLVRAATTKKYPILLQGPTSSGKTSMVEYLAKRTGHAFVRINNHENTDLQEYLGSYMSDDQGNLSFQEGILVEAIRKGHWLVLDELNLAPSDVLEALNRLLDDNRELLIPETQEVIKPHPSFVLFATQNPAGLYGGRKHLSRAFRNRFLELHFEDIPEDELETILCQRCQVAPTYCKRIVEVYKQLSIRRQSSRVFEQKNSFATLRDLFRWAMRPAVGYDELALNGYVLLAERVRRNEEKVIVQEVIEKVMKVSLTGVHDYAISDLTEYQIVVASGRDVQVVWTRAMRRLFILMALAFRNNEPVLLVGETGCGKTAVCQLIAEALNRPIQILNAHQNTETADMIGAQRPVRNRAQLSALLIADLLDFFRTHDPTKEYPTDLETLRTAFEALDFRILLDEQPQLEAKIVDLQHRLVQSKALFEWADGPLVQAMKEGQIFLMDEISLAEDAVLERLNSVLETGRSLVIAEKGAQDTGLTASPAYQFCATMNPGGDFGKKELSAALRNRFTEIWVPAMSDDTDMLQILAATLKSDRAHLGPIMINFARYFCQAFATALTSTVVSLRDLLAWARFCNQDVSDIRESFVQGAALVYIDALGATLHSADLDEVSTLRKQRQSCLAELTRLAGYECHQYYQTPYVLHSAPGVLAIGPYAITTGTTAAGPDIFELQAPTTFINATRVFRAMQLRKPILLEGSPGVGKTSLISAIAAMASKNLVRINFSDQTDLMDLFGSDTPVEDGGSLAFAWRDAPFLRAMQNGDWVLLDEMNLASQSILEGLNACLDHRGEAYIPELNRTFSCHPDFRIFAAQNPHSQGGGRKGLPKSFINRFTVVYCDPLNSSDIRHICYTKFSTLPTETVNNVIDLVFKIQHEANNRKNFAVAGGPWEFNLRDVFRWLSIIYRSDESAYASYYADAILRQRFRSLADRNSTDLCIEQIFGEAAAYRPAFALHTSEILGVGRTSTMRNASCTIADEYRPVLGAHRAAMEAILLCVDKAWPCILVGQSGSGKTVLLESIAQLLGHRLHTISINNDMDASDLLGGFEQRDATRHVAQVCKQIEQFCKDTIGHNLLSDSHEPLVDLICRIRTETQDEALLHTAHTVLSDFQPDTSAILSDLVKIQAEINQPSLGQFQWSDGSLVRAVTDGEWLVLDNANLCNPSVLDRLNSLLEPNGQLLVNERVMPDGQPMVVTPHPNFRLFLTMDPQNGELSRAMRNRGLEIFLMSGEAQTSFLPHTKSMSSTWSTAIHAADHSTEPSSDILRYLAECVGEHMPHDLGQCQFFGLTVSQNELFNIVLQVRKTLSQHFSLSPKSRVQSSESDVLCSVGSRVGTDAAILEFRALQLHFLCNELDAAWVHALKTLSTVLPKPALHDLSILVTVRTRICDYVVGQSSQALEGIDTLEIILTRLMFFVHACYTDTPLELLISVLRVVDRHIQSKLPSTVDLGLSRVLSTANYLVPLTSGACMERMWSALKPSSPVNRIAMDHYENLHALLQRLDESTILSRNSLPVIVQLKKRCLQTLNVVRHSSDIPGDTDPQAIASQLMPLTIESAHEEGASSSVFTSLFRHILHKVQLQQVSQFASWQDTEVPVLNDLLHLSSQAKASTIELLDFLKPEDNLKQPTTARVWALSRVVLMGSGSSDLEQENVRTLPASTSHFLQDWASLLLSTHELQLGSVQMSLHGLYQIGRSATDHSVSLVKATTVSLAHILIQQLSVLTSVLGNNAEASEAPLLDTNLNLAKLRFTSVDDASIETQEGSSTLVAIRDLDIPEAAKSLLLEAQANLLEQDHSASGTSSTKSLGVAYIKFSFACLLLYVPNVPKDPGTESILHSKFCDWVLHRAEKKAQAQKIVHESFTGGTESPRTDLVDRHVQDAYLKSLQAPGISLLRPERSQLHQLQAEFDFCLALAEEDGPAQQLLHSYLSGSPMADSQFENVAHSLNKLEARLQKWSGYQDVIGPVLVALSGLRTGFRLLSENQQFHQRDLSLTTTNTIMPDPLQVLNNGDILSNTPKDKSSILAAVLQLRLRLSIFGYQQKDYVLLRKYSRQMFEEWFVRREQEMREAEQSTSVFKYTADTEPSIDDYTELFPDYEGVNEQIRKSDDTRAVDTRIFAELSAMLKMATQPGVQQSVSLLDTMKNLLDLSDPRSDHKEVPQAEACILATATYAASRNLKALENDQIHKTDPDYDFYRSSNISQTKKIISMLSQLITRIREIISVWPENSVLLDIEENVQRLLNASMALPVAQSLTMLENIFGLLAQWQEVASREFAVDSLFAIVRDQIIEWRRFELSCWPRLFGLEERAVLREDAKMWYNLYEVLIFSPEQHQGDLGDDFLRNTVQLLMQFMRSSNVGQFSGRLELLETFSRFVSLTAGEEDRHQFLDEAVRHVLYHFTAYLPQVNAFLTQERSVLAKEVNQVIKLASWKDTNVFALRESSRRSHRTLYKLVHKYRRVLLVPVQQLLAKGLRELTTEPVRKQAIPVQLDLARPESLNHGVVWSQDQWPARYQEPSRTAKKINTVQQLVQANSANHLQLFVDDAIASMKQLRSETPTVFEKSKIPLIKHLKNRKRKLLSDSFKALKELGLKSVLRADDLESQRDAETLFLSVPAQQWNMQPDSIEQYFYRLVDILPNVRTGYANHAEDVTAGEVKRGIGYFDSIMSHLLKERSTLYTFCSHIKRFELGQAQFFSVCVGQQRGLRELDVRGNYGAFSAWRTQAAQSVATLKQMLELTTAYHEAYRGFTSKPCTSLANLPWWEQLVYDLDCMESGVLSDQQIVCPLSSWESEAEHLNVILRTAHAHCCAYQNDNQDAAYILENLAVWLAHKLQSQDTINSKEIPELTATVLSNKLFKLCDTMLLATQNINLSSRRETPDSDQSLWYVRASIRHRSRLRSANLATIANDLLEITHCMQEGSLQISSHELQRLCTQVAPVVQAYYQMCVALDQEYRAFHNNTSRCALLIGQTLQTLASSGFCSPEPADQNPGESKATEDGTGLGSGQGADDITKDLEDDEDLGDLEGAEDIDGQNEKDDKDEAKEIEDDVGGALEDVDEQENSDDDASGSDDGSDMDEEIGEVDEENDTALDEKMWDSEKDDLREKETEKKDQEQQQEDEQNQDIDLVNREDQTEENEQAEKPEQPEEKPEKVDDTEQELNNDKDNDNDEEIRDDGDDRIDEAHNLELPEDMNIDDEVDLDEDENEDGEEQSEEVDSNDVDDVSDDVSEQNPADDKGDDMNESMEDADSEKDGEEVDAKADEEKGAVEEEEEATEVPTVEDNTNQKEETEEQIDDMTVDEGGSEAGGDDKDTNDIGKNSTENKEQRTEQDAENLEIETTEVEKDNQDSTENDAQGTDGKTGEQSASSDDQGSEEIRSLGNALEQFRRLLHIHDAPSQENKTAKDQEQEDSQNHDGADQFEHIADDETPDTQAMGPNKQEDATVPGQNSEDIVPELEDNRPEPIEDESMGLDEDENPPLVNDENGKSIQDENPLENSLQEFSRQDKSHSDHEDENMEDDQDKVEPVMAIQQATSASAQLWQKYQQSTRDLANGLSEQLRLILEPTLATKMKGDFRTGKRLNMRRIIPYIASQFKKDKIWMRRSKPSKRQYQVMLAIDDSKSMSESSSVQLAFETVALVSTALSVLEVGQMSVVKFGSQPEIVHSFQDQFSSESGSKIFESFTFDQTKTNVKALAAQSLDMFRDARATQHSSGAELWQLQFIISDGICEDHESIRRIMRQAQEERIMVVFLVIDTIHGAKKHSILQMSQVKYLTQPDGSKKLHIIQYMEEFAFENFLIIQNVSELPELLCSTIRQFFAASQ